MLGGVWKGALGYIGVGEVADDPRTRLAARLAAAAPRLVAAVPHRSGRIFAHGPLTVHPSILTPCPASLPPALSRAASLWEASYTCPPSAAAALTRSQCQGPLLTRPLRSGRRWRAGLRRCCWMWRPWRTGELPLGACLVLCLIFSILFWFHLEVRCVANQWPEGWRRTAVPASCLALMSRAAAGLICQSAP